jgi:hypothetical protein
MRSFSYFITVFSILRLTGCNFRARSQNFRLHLPSSSCHFLPWRNITNASNCINLDIVNKFIASILIPAHEIILFVNSYSHVIFNSAITPCLTHNHLQSEKLFHHGGNTTFGLSDSCHNLKGCIITLRRTCWGTRDMD